MLRYFVHPTCAANVYKEGCVFFLHDSISRAVIREVEIVVEIS